jgi:glycosyltransferase involved in cell wall biosynthesis
MRLSIAIAYYNRRELLLATLDSFLETLTNWNEFEVIIVDDASDDKHKLDASMFDDYPFYVKVIRIPKKDKWWTSSTIAINMSIRHSTGDIVIIQNPETIHVGDIISHAIENCTDTTLLSYHCYAANEEKTKRILDLDEKEVITLRRAIEPIDDSCWYNHAIFRSKAYHFTNAVKRKHLLKMRGMDERFAEGVAYEDDEFIYRLRLMGLEIRFISHPFSIHMHHEKFNNLIPNIKQLEARNKHLFETVTLVERKVVANEYSSNW